MSGRNIIGHGRVGDRLPAYPVEYPSSRRGALRRWLRFLVLMWCAK